jgi:hypothetical protein
MLVPIWFERLDSTAARSVSPRAFHWRLNRSLHSERQDSTQEIQPVGVHRHGPHAL